jgi:phage terminase large subunit
VDPSQENAIEEFGLYEYDRKSIEKGREIPVKTHDHAMDAIRYLVMGMWGKMKRFLPVQDEEEDE